MSADLKPRIRLRTKLLAAITVLVLLLVLALSYALNARLLAVANTALDDDLSRTLSVFDRIVRERAEGLYVKALLLSDDSHLKAAIDVPKPNVTTTTDVCMVLNDFAKVPLFLVTDKRGRILFDAHHIPEANLALLEGREPDPSRMRPAPETGSEGWSNVRKALQGEGSEGVLVHSVPAASGDGESSAAFQTVTVPIRIKEQILGALILGFPLDDELAGQMKAMTDSEVAVSIHGKVFASTWEVGRRPMVEAGLASAQGRGEGVGEGERKVPVLLGEEHYLALFSPIRDTEGKELGVYAILRSQDKAFELQRTLQRTIAVIGASGLAVAFLLSLVIARRITEPLGSLLRGVQEVAGGKLDGTVPVVTHDELGVLGTAFNRMIQGLREKERVTHILGKYVSPEVAKRILAEENGLVLKGERRECAVMFTDIRGFTAMSENAAPERIVADLNEYFTLMVDVVFKYEGTLDKFIGDALMAVWGAPVPFEDKELRAVRAALEMQEALRNFNEERVRSGRNPIAMGIGVNVGVVVSGNLGSDRRTDYTVIGEEVNLASRLCSKAAPGQVLVSEALYRKLKGLVEVKALEPIELKGFTGPVRVYEVTGVLSKDPTGV